MGDDRIDLLSAELNNFRNRFEWWQELRQTDDLLYESIKKQVYETAEMVDLIKRFLIREKDFNPRKELEFKIKEQDERNKKSRVNDPRRQTKKSTG